MALKKSEQGLGLQGYHIFNRSYDKDKRKNKNKCIRLLRGQQTNKMTY